jgi:hypothetical protein
MFCFKNSGRLFPKVLRDVKSFNLCYPSIMIRVAVPSVEIIAHNFSTYSSSGHSKSLQDGRVFSRMDNCRIRCNPELLTNDEICDLLQSRGMTFAEVEYAGSFKK